MRVNLRGSPGLVISLLQLEEMDSDEKKPTQTILTILLKCVVLTCKCLTNVSIRALVLCTEKNNIKPGLKETETNNEVVAMVENMKIPCHTTKSHVIILHTVISIAKNLQLSTVLE